MTAVGADADRLAATGRRFVASASALRTHRRALDELLGSTRWSGVDADRHRHEWAVSTRHLADAGEFVDRLGKALIVHADEQRAASAATGSRAIGLVAPEWLDDFLDDVVDEIRDVLADRGGAGPTAGVDGRRPERFGAPIDGRDAVLDAMGGLASDHRIGRDEIEIRALDNGRYIVVLPGVTDLSDGFDEFVERVREAPLDLPDAGRDAFEAWADNDEPTVRKTRYAFEAALRDDTTVNEYSVATIEALQAAGVPPGAEVAIVGHSFGAYTAMDLAADTSFNSVHGATSDGYHVEITHVIAAGAETDWRFDELPEGTRALVVNNRFDGVYRAEDLLHRNARPEHPGQVEHAFWGGWSDYGHDERHYLAELRTTGDDEVTAWLDELGRSYADAGVRVSAPVPDPNL